MLKSRLWSLRLVARLRGRFRRRRRPTPGGTPHRRDFSRPPEEPINRIVLR